MELRKPGGMPQAGGFSLPSVPDELRAASPKHIMQDTGKVGSQQTSPVGSVTDNRAFTANISVDGGGMVNLDVSADSPLAKAVVAIVEDKFRQEGYRDGGAGWV